MARVKLTSRRTPSHPHDLFSDKSYSNTNFKGEEGGKKVPYVDPPQLNAIRHAQVPGKIYLYIRRYRPKRTICFFAYIAGTAAVVGLSRELLLAGTIAGNTWTIT